MKYNSELIMPSNFSLMDEEEMTYIDGGYKFSMSRTTAGRVIDVAAIIATAGLSSSAKIGTIAAKIGWTKLKASTKKAMIKLGVSQAAAATGVSILTTATGFSLGGGASWVLDKTDKSGLNGYIQY